MLVYMFGVGVFEPVSLYCPLYPMGVWDRRGLVQNSRHCMSRLDNIKDGITFFIVVSQFVAARRRRCWNWASILSCINTPTPDNAKSPHIPSRKSPPSGAIAVLRMMDECSPENDFRYLIPLPTTESLMKDVILLMTHESGVIADIAPPLGRSSHPPTYS